MGLVVGVGLVVSGCTADEPDASPTGDTGDTGDTAGTADMVDAVELHPAPEVGDPMPEHLLPDGPDTADSGIVAEDYEFLYRTGDDSVEYYRGPDGFDLRAVGGPGGDSVCLSVVDLSTEINSIQCVSASGLDSDLSLGGPFYVGGEVIGGGLLSQSPPDDDLPWSNPVDGFWVIDVSDEQ